MKVPQPRKLKSGTWFCQLRLGGESIPVTATTEKECRRQASLIKAEYLNGKKSPCHNEITLRQAIDKYIASRENSLSPSTIAGYRAIQRLYFQEVADKPLSAVKDWQPVVDRLAGTHSAKTVENAWGFIRSILRDQKINPPKLTLPQTIEKEPVFLEPEQIEVFVDAVVGKPVCIPALLALHSLRRSEIMAVNWKTVNLKEKTFKVAGAAVYDEHHKLVYKEENKNRKSRRPMPIMIPQLAEALDAVEEKTGNVVKCCPNTIWKQVNRICEQNGLPLVGVHGLRHSFASLAYHVGLSERQTMELGGWRDKNTMHKIYTHLSKMDALKAQNEMAAFYAKAKENANQNANRL